MTTNYTYEFRLQEMEVDVACNGAFLTTLNAGTIEEALEYQWTFRHGRLYGTIFGLQIEVAPTDNGCNLCIYGTQEKSSFAVGFHAPELRWIYDRANLHHPFWKLRI